MIYLVRHGQTDWNLFKRFNGCTDVFLNKTGIEQAKQLIENVNDICFDVCFCSPQTRARQFCEIIYKGSVVLDDRLTEIDCGEFEGTEENVESMELFWSASQNGDKGVESFKAFINRNCDLCDSIMAQCKGKNVLIVTHAANARVINYYFKSKPYDYDFSKTVLAMGQMISFDAN